jgi:dienelactone hydrolase
MNQRSTLSRRGLLRLAPCLAAVPALSRVIPAFAQDLGPGNRNVGGEVGGRDDARLGGKGLPGGGQVDFRLNQTVYTSDADELEVAQRIRPFDPKSWYDEWLRVAQRNEEIAEGYAAQKLNVSANEFYMRAVRFYYNAIMFQEPDEPTTMPGYKKVRELFDKAWQAVPPPFERVTLTVDGNKLGGYFRKPGGPAGTKFPTVYFYLGSDTSAETSIVGANSYLSRGMAVLVVDLPGQGAAMRLQDLHMSPDPGKLVTDLINYLETRPDVDATRIGIRGISLGGWSAPRAAASEKRIKAIATTSAFFDVLHDVFDYFPPVQPRLAWIVGAKDLQDGRKRLKEYTLEDVAQKIECPMLIGYGPADRICDPNGAFRLYKAAVNSDRKLWSGAGHGNHDRKSGGARDVGLPTAEDWMARRLGAHA